MGLEDVPACVDEYLADFERSDEYSLISSAMNLMAFRSSEDGFVRFGAVDAEDFAADLCAADVEEGLMGLAARNSLFVAASFFRWLGRSSRLRRL